MKTPALPPTDHQPRAYTGPSADEVLALRKQFMNPGIFLYYKKPLMVVEGHRQYVWDEKGKRYLDGLGGIVTVSVGHCHPHVIAAGNAQNETYQHSTTIYLHPNVAQYAEKLASKMPGNLKMCYFVNSGSEANDLALMMARAHTGNYDIIALRNAYHGGNQSTMGITAHSTWKYNVPHGFGFHHALAPYPYRGTFGYDDPQAGAKYANDVKELIEYATPGKSPASSPNPSRAWADLSNSRRATSNTSTAMCAPPAECASPTKCRPASAVPARTFGDSKRRVLSRTSSPWPRASAMAAPSLPW